MSEENRQQGRDQVVAIIGAMDEEVALIAKGLENPIHDERSAQASLDVVRGSLQGASGPIQVVATVGGMGTVNIAATTQ